MDEFENGQCGRLTLDATCRVAMKLGFFRAIYSLRDPTLVRQLLVGRYNGDALVLTDLAFDQSTQTMVERRHCRLALDWADSSSPASPVEPSILLFSPSQNSAPADIWVPMAELEKQLVHFLLLVGSGGEDLTSRL